MKAVLQFLRVPEWYDSKIPMLLSVPLYFFVLDIPQSRRAVLFLVSFFIFLFTYLAFGYVVNDLSDMETDRKAGKKKLITKILKPWVIVIIAVLITVGTVPLCLFSQSDWKVMLALLVNYVLGASYSLKPLRFKERGVAGLVISSAAQRCTPLLIIPLLWNTQWILMIGWQILSFLAGLRYILIHQYMDYEADLQSGVRTFATKHKKASALGVYICFASEVTAMLLLSISLLRQTLWFGAIFVLYAVFALLARHSVQRLMRQPFVLGYTYVPMEDFYNVLLPLSLAALWVLQAQSVEAIITLILLLCYLLNTIQRKGALILLTLKVKVFGTKPIQ